MPEITGTTKYESLFRCSMVRGFASDWRVKSAHAAHGLGGEALAGQAFQRHVTDSCPGPAQSPHAEWLPSKPPHTLTRKGVVFPRGPFKIKRHFRYSVWALAQGLG